MATFANILYDDTFKVVLAEPSNRQLLIKLVEFFLPGKKIESLSLDDKEQHGLILSDKNCTFDLYCTTDTGEQLIVEMQYSSQESFKDRMLYYSTYPIRSQLIQRFKDINEQEELVRKRGKMDYSLRPVHVISILNFKLEHERENTLEEGMISRYDLRSERSGELMTDALHFVFFELARLPRKADEEKSCRTLLEQLAFSLKYGHLLRERPEGFEDEMLKLLFNATAFANMDELQLEKYNTIMTTKLDIIAQQEYAKKEGRVEGRLEGRVEGRAEGMRELIQKFIASGMPKEEIAGRLAMSINDLDELLDG